MPDSPPRAKSLSRRNSSVDTNKIHSSYAWEKISKTHRVQYPICQRCDYMGDITRDSTQGLSVHHITSLSEDITIWDNSDNLLTLCTRCHHIYTELENAGKHGQSQADGHMVRNATQKRFW